ncbi:MAG: methyltransferase [Verrucomicrobiae bacterium]|nr:methyltransferase [Verrucomicrobiae bacterium]
MTSRQLVHSALDHRQPPRVPVDFGGHRSSGIMAIAYAKLRRHLGLPARPPRVFDIIQQLATVEEDVLDRFGVDTVELGRGFCAQEKWWKEWRLPDGTECLIPAWADLRKKGDDWFLHAPSGRPTGVQKAGSLYFEQVWYPFVEGIPDDLSRLHEVMPECMWAWPSPPGPAAPDPAALEKGARELRARTDRAVLALFGGNLLEWTQFLCRNDQCFVFLGSEPEAAHRLLDALVEIHLDNLERFLGAVGEHVDLIMFGDDLGMQKGPQISPRMYREFFKPRHSLMWKRAKKLAPVKVMLHCCGGVRPLLDDLIDAGLDAINPVQTTCEGMDAVALKRDFGGRLCFWGGGCDTRAILPRGTPDEVRRHVLERLGIMAPGGGFVFQQVHNIMSDVPPENVVAMFDAIAEFNRRG